MDKTNNQFKEERIKTADENYPVSPITRKMQNKVMTYQLSPNRLILNHRKAIISFQKMWKTRQFHCQLYKLPYVHNHLNQYSSETKIGKCIMAKKFF